MTITVLDGFTLNPGDVPWTPFESLGRLVVHDRTPPELIVERARGSEVVLTNKTPLSAEAIERLPELRYIGVLATGYNVVDVQAARRRGIVVTNVPEYGTDAVAQHTFALLPALIHRVEAHDAAVRAGEWRRRGDFSCAIAPMSELAGRTLGIVGYGRIGRRVGAIGRALGMNVVAHSRSRPGVSLEDGTPSVSLEELFAQADVITLHCPQTPENAGFVNRALLARMKPGAYFLNTARGGLVNEQDLADALDAGQLAGAAVDVVGVEPIREDNPLLRARNCLITPHVAWVAVEARRRLMDVAASNLRAFLDGRTVNVVS